jgi:hypothetical protein
LRQLVIKAKVSAAPVVLNAVAKSPRLPALAPRQP